jgi:hypothetical protein
VVPASIVATIQRCHMVISDPVAFHPIWAFNTRPHQQDWQREDGRGTTFRDSGRGTAMERRRFLTGAAVTAAGILVGAPAEAAYRPTPGLVYSEGGGFVPAGYDHARPPQLVVYRDGLVIADAERQMRLRSAAVDELLRHSVRVLRDPANGKLTLGPEDPQIADAPTSSFEARWRGGKLRLDAYALPFYRSAGGYPKATYALYDEIVECRRKVRRLGTPYQPDAIRLVAVLSGGGPVQETRAWPARVPEPVFPADTWWSSRDMRGRAAQIALDALPRKDVFDWKAYRLADGRVVSVTWRRLLPHE